MRIRSLDGVGLTHKMEQSVTQICSALGFRAPEELNSLNVTDSLPEEDPCFAKVENFELTTRFKAIIEDLVVYDQLLFYAAATEFYWRSKFLTPPVKSESAVSAERAA